MTRRMLVAWGVAFSLFLGSQAATAAPDPQEREIPTLISDLTIVISPGKTITGSVLFENGLIKAVGELKAGQIPAGVRRIDGKGLVAYAGFMDALSHLGLHDRKPWDEGLKERQGVQEDAQAGPPIRMPEARLKGLRPSFSVADSLVVDAKAHAAWRKAGFTSALIAPRNGYLSGLSAVLNLGEGPRRGLVVRSPVALHGALLSGGGAGYPSTAMGVLAHIRQYLFDAQRHAVWTRLYRRNPSGIPRPPSDADLRVAALFMGGRAPVVFAARRENEIIRVLGLARSFRLRLSLADGREAWRLAKVLKAMKIPVISSLEWDKEPKSKKKKKPASKPPAKKGPVKKAKKKTEKKGQPEPSKRRPVAQEAGVGSFMVSAIPGVGGMAPWLSPRPETKKTAQERAIDARLKETEEVFAERKRLWTEDAKNLIRLHEAGVTFAVGSLGLRNPGQVFGRLRRLIGWGLPEEAAIAALTTVPAKLHGLSKVLGSTEPGKIANLTILSKPFKDKGARVRLVVVDGLVYDFPAPKKKAKKAGAKTPAIKAVAVAGLWELDVEGQYRGKMTLKQSGKTLEGRVESRYGEASLEGSIEGSVIKFTISLEVQGQSVTIEAEGKVSGQSMSGSLNSPMGEGRWTAKRLPESSIATHREPIGNWLERLAEEAHSGCREDR